MTAADDDWGCYYKFEYCAGNQLCISQGGVISNVLVDSFSVLVNTSQMRLKGEKQ